MMVFLAQAHSQHLSSLTIGIVLAASGAGGALGSAAASRLFRLVEYSLLRIQMWAWTATFGVLALSGGRSFLAVAAAMAVLGFTGALGNIALNTFVVRHAAETMLARVMSVDRVTSFGALAVGPALGGILYEQWGTRHAMVALLIATCFLLVPASTEPLRRRNQAAVGNPAGDVAP
jgi:predicted MFS family arabinose efflux permease